MIPRTINVAHTANWLRTSSRGAMFAVLEAMEAKAKELGVTDGQLEANPVIPSMADGDVPDTVVNAQAVLDWVQSIKLPPEKTVAHESSEIAAAVKALKPKEKESLALRQRKHRFEHIQTMLRLLNTARLRR